MQRHRSSGAPGMMRLHGYWRSSAAYRVRIALALKGLAAEAVPHDLRTGAQHDPAWRARNPQGLVPALEVDGPSEDALVIPQSLAIIEWLDETHPAPPLLPTDPEGRAIVRAMAQLVCADIHPLNNLRVLKALRHDFGADDAAINAWAARWIGDGLAALEVMVARHGGGFAYGDAPGMADCCLIPQLYSAARFGVETTQYPALVAVAARCAALPAFATAHPDRQPDADP